MKYFVLVILIAAAVFVSCKKTNSTTTSVSFYNGTWSLDAITAAWNGGTIIASPLAQGQSSVKADSAYIQVQAGTNLITVKAGATTLLDKNIYSMAAAASSFIFFDTSTTAAPVRIMQLTDDLTLPDTGTFKYRVINLVPDTSVKADIWLVNGAADSVQLASANTFIGSTAEASAVQTFDTTTYRRTPYTIKFKKTGTEEIYAAVATYPFAAQGVYSIMFSGLPGGAGNTGFKLTVLHHHIP